MCRQTEHYQLQETAFFTTQAVISTCLTGIDPSAANQILETFVPLLKH
jgi:hypothetical protein